MAPTATDVGPGWSQLVNPLIMLVESVGGQVDQIKEKFGGLRFYANGIPDWAQEIIDLIETYSFQVCEDCGKVNGALIRKGVSACVRPRSSPTGYRWIKTRCDDCERAAYPDNPDLDREVPHA